ncbi:MAG: hypothetical protein L6R39_000398 [Caloplaca ligustica]|nr:MAG: hypothetical protein L6R39_000398 [Caloplaca ligustica]
MSNFSVSVPLVNPSVTLDQFYCQNTRDKQLSCLSISQFATSNFDQLCPSGSCLDACQDLERLYAVIPPGLQVQADKYGHPTSIPYMITLYGICLGYANISRALHGAQGLIPPKEAAVLNPLFPPSTEDDLQGLSNGATRCLSETCEKSINGSRCAWNCSPAQLLLNSTTPRLSGPYQCLKTICQGGVGLPFGDQDVVGVGVGRLLAPQSVQKIADDRQVTISYVIQSVLVLFSWLGLSIASWTSFYQPTRSGSAKKAKEVFLESLNSFQRAQCYFSIPIAVTTLITDPFHLDTVNGFGFLPVAINGFLPQTFNLLQLHRHKRLSWYISSLTFLSWLLSTINFWAIIKYLRVERIGTRDAEFRSLSNIETCGSLNALSLCIQAQDISPLDWLFHTKLKSTNFGSSILFGTTTIGTSIVPTIWVFCTTVLLVLLGHQCFGSSGLGIFYSRSRAPPSLPAHFPRQRRLLTKFRYLFTNPWTATIAFHAASAMFLLCTVYQGMLYYNYLALDLVDLDGWSFGQIIAITVWIPVISDYMHLQFKESIVPPLAGLISRSPPAVSEAHLPLTASDSSYQPCNAHTYERMSDSQQQQQQQRGGGRRERFDGNGGDYDKGKRNAEEYPTSALESRKGGMQLRILTALRSEGDA